MQHLPLSQCWTACYHCVKSVQIGSFFWSVFSRIRTEYGEIRSISPYLVRIRENTDQKKLRTWILENEGTTSQLLEITIVGKLLPNKILHGKIF